jgi:hypothetical protein
MFMPIKLRPGGMLFFINSFCRLGFLSSCRIIGVCSIGVRCVEWVFLQSACRFIICSLILGEKMLCLWSGWKSEFREEVVIVDRWVFTGLGKFIVELRLELHTDSIYCFVFALLTSMFSLLNSTMFLFFRKPVVFSDDFSEFFG